MGNSCSKGGKSQTISDRPPEAPAAVVVSKNGTANGAVPSKVPKVTIEPPDTAAPPTTARRESRTESRSSDPPYGHAPSTGSTGNYGRTTGLDYEALEREAKKENYLQMREDFLRNQKQFLVNQLLLSVQFFKNFEKDKEAIRNMKHDSEEEVRDSLTERRQTATVANTMYNKIHDYIGFKSFEQNNVLEQLLPTEYYISHEFIETNRKEDFERLANGSMEYSQVDEPYYRTTVESANHFGYSKLRCVDDYDDLIEEELDDDNTSDVSANAPPSPLPTPLESVTAKSSEPRLQVTLPNQKKNDIAYDRFPSPVLDNKKKIHFKPKLPDNSIEELDEEEEESPQTGNDLLRSIAGRLNNKPQNSAFIFPSAPRSPTSTNRLAPQHERSDPNAFRSNGFGRDVTKADIDNLSPQKQEKHADGEDSPTSNGRSSKANSVYSLDEDAYGYVTTKSKSLADFVSAGFKSKKNRHNVLPARCFKKVEHSLREENDDFVPLEEDEKEIRVYISSKNFMQHFAVNFYELAGLINKSHLPSGARILDPRIMTHDEKPSEGSFAKESSLDFIPSVDIGFWPDDGIEWYLRKRNKIREKRTKRIYQWPSAEIVSQAQQIGCNLVPIGYINPKRGKDSVKQLIESTTQWEVQFVRAEQLIERNLNHPKIRSLLFANLLYKTFLAEINAISPVHMRYLFYWMVEKAPAGWIDEQLGEKIMQMIKDMKHHLRTSKMQHYFISKKNMFENIPKHRLLKAHEKFHRLQENLVPFLMIAIKQLQTEKFFFPLPDIEELYNILTTSDTLALLNPSLMMTVGAMGDATNAFQRNKKVHELQNKAAQNQMKKGDASQQRLRQMHKRRIEQKTAEMKAREAEAKEIIRTDLVIEKFDDNRSRLILEFFIMHFIQLAKKSNEFNCHGQGLMYINQASNLMQLLIDLRLDGSSAHMGFKTELEQLRQVNRGTAEDYWNLNWGVEERSGGGPGLFRTGSGPGGVPQIKVQSDPLPKPPKTPSPKFIKQSEKKTLLRLPSETSPVMSAKKDEQRSRELQIVQVHDPPKNNVEEESDSEDEDFVTKL